MRGLLRAAAAVVLAGWALLAASPASARDGRTLWLRDVHTGQELRLRPFGRLGRVDRVAWARISHFLGSRRTGRVLRTYPRTMRMLAQLQRHFDGRRIDVTSGYRGPGDPRSEHSYHSLGRALDFRMPGTPPRALFEYCRRLPRMGCGLYPHRGFAHVDARPRPAVWVDLTTGEGSEYVTGVAEWLGAHPRAGR